MVCCDWQVVRGDFVASEKLIESAVQGSVVCYAAGTCEIILSWNNFTIISVFYFTCNHVWNWNKIRSAAEGVRKLFQRQWICWKILWAEISLWNNFEIISGKFPCTDCTDINLFHTNVDAGWNNFEMLDYECWVWIWSQLALWWLSHKPGGMLPSPSANLTATSLAKELTPPWLIPNYTAWWQRQTFVCSFSEATMQWCPTRTETCDLWIASPLACQ